MALPFKEGDTIVALATPPGRGALALVRLSGAYAWDIAQRCWRGRGDEAPRLARVGELSHPVSEEAIDRAVLILWRRPASYTGEDMAEFTLHAGPSVVAAALEAFAAAGARPAEAGEFTWRAVAHGKLNLSQAQAVADLAAARTGAARRDALRRMAGELSNRLNAIREAVVEARGLVEAHIDFGVPAAAAEVYELVYGAALEARALVARGREREVLTEGALVALAGAPNAGKSTLFNALAGAERAIVHHEPGTTRDVIEAAVVVGGALVRLADMAGLGESNGAVEAEGMRRARKLVEDAALVLWLDDVSAEPAAAPPAVPAEKLIKVLSKVDLKPHAKRPPVLDAEKIIMVSAQTAAGLDYLRAAIAARLGPAAGDAGYDEGLSLSSRERFLVDNTARHLMAAAERLEDRGEIDEIAAEELGLAADALGRVCGAVDVEEVYDEVFKRFCLGK